MKSPRNKSEFIYVATDEHIIPVGTLPLGGLPMMDYLIDHSNLKRRILSVPYHNSGMPIISNIDIIKSMIGICAQGKFDFAVIDGFRNDPFFRDALQMNNVPSQETLRQRFDKMKPVVKDILDEESLMLIKHSKMPLSPTLKDDIPVDIDVSPFDNSNSKKEGCNCTYKICDGFAPMFAYFGTEGYLLGCE